MEAWFVCDRAHGDRAEPSCQSIAGPPIDEAIGALVVEKMTPAAVELALQIRSEIEARQEEADQLRCRAIEKAQIEADLAQRRFMLVDPSNRLVADTLEAEWNDKLRALAKAREDRQRGRDQHQRVLNNAIRERLIAMTADFKRLWADPGTPNRERKRMLAHIIEDATRIKLPAEGITKIHIHFKGGRTETLTTLIRRYPDLMVHRAIKASLAKEKPGKLPLAEIGMHCSATERRADEATRDVEAWLKTYYMRDHVGNVYTGTVSATTSFGIFVALDEAFVEGLVHVTELGQDYFHNDQSKHWLIGERTGKRFRLGDRVTVKVVRADIETSKIDFTLVEEPRAQLGQVLVVFGDIGYDGNGWAVSHDAAVAFIGLADHIRRRAAAGIATWSGR